MSRSPNSYSKIITWGGLCWIALCAILTQLFWADGFLWSLTYAASFFAYAFSKQIITLKLSKKGIDSPLVILAFQGFYFLIALFLVALVMLLSPETKKIHLPLILVNALVFLGLDLWQMLKQHPNNSTN